MRSLLKLSLSAAAVFSVLMCAAPSPASALQPAYAISTDLTLSAADLACNCSIQVYVVPGADVFVDLPGDGSFKWSPIVFFSADNLGAFTVRTNGGSRVILSHFTTRGAVGHNPVAERWNRVE